MASYLDFEAYYNGSWIPYSKIMISPDDRGFMLSDAVFDVGRHLTVSRFVGRITLIGCSGR